MKKTFSSTEVPEAVQECMDKISDLIDTRIAALDGDGLCVLGEALSLYIEIMKKTLVDPELTESYIRNILPDEVQTMPVELQNQMAVIVIKARLRDATRLEKMFVEISDVMDADEKRAHGGLN